MYALMLISFMLLVTMLGTASFDRIGTPHEQNHARAIAHQMHYWHMAAIRACDPGPCPSGQVDAAPFLDEAMSGASGYANDRIRTVSDGSGLLVTYWSEHQNGNATHPGLVTTVLRQMSGNSYYYSGGYDEAASRLGARPATDFRVADPGITVPNSVAGVTFRDRAPMLATLID